MSEYFDAAEFYSESKIPELTKQTLGNYIHKGIMPGSFVMSMLENDLRKTYLNADNDNLVAIPSIFAYIRNSAPGLCWGSTRAVREWIEIGGMEGYMKGIRPRAEQEEEEY